MLKQKRPEKCDQHKKTCYCKRLDHIFRKFIEEVWLAVSDHPSNHIALRSSRNAETSTATCNNKKPHPVGWGF